eukprot:Colp12_sorted_trinity150504_noHs@22856
MSVVTFLSRRLSGLSRQIFDENMAPTALVFLAGGAEEMETVIVVDVLRRGGVETVLAGLEGSGPVQCSRHVTVVPDCSVEDALTKHDSYDLVVIPGGLGGAKAIAASEKAGAILKKQRDNSGYIGAICAGPIALLSHQLHLGAMITSHPSVKDQLSGMDGRFCQF